MKQQQQARPRPFNKETDVTFECPCCHAYKTVDRINLGLPTDVILVESACSECGLDDSPETEVWYTAPGVKWQMSVDDASPVEIVYQKLLHEFRAAQHDGDTMKAARVDAAICVLEEFWPADCERWRDRFKT